MITTHAEVIDYKTYYDHAFTLNEAELALRARLLTQVPGLIIDAHVHAGGADHFDEAALPTHIFGHMMSTFPVVTVEQSQLIDRTFLPGKDVRKVRFAHAFTGIGHQAVNAYLLESSPSSDAVALFGLSNCPDDIGYTIDELRSRRYAGLKMYYNASNPPKSQLYDYFPPDVLHVAEAVGVPIILHLPHSLYNSAAEVEQLTAEHPNLKVILAHIGVAHVVKPELDKILRSIAASGNVYVDTSAVENPQLVLSALQQLGYGNVLYGSDEPLSLIRSVVYENPSLGPRLLTDYPYHWADQQEQEQWGHLFTDKFVHAHWRQLQAIVDAVNQLHESPQTRARVLEDIFYANAARLFGFEV